MKDNNYIQMMNTINSALGDVADRKRENVPNEISFIVDNGSTPNISLSTNNGSTILQTSGHVRTTINVSKIITTNLDTGETIEAKLPHGCGISKIEGK